MNNTIKVILIQEGEPSPNNPVEIKKLLVNKEAEKYINDLKKENKKLKKQKNDVVEYIKKNNFKYCDDELCYMIPNHFNNLLRMLGEIDAEDYQEEIEKINKMADELWQNESIRKVYVRQSIDDIEEEKQYNRILNKMNELEGKKIKTIILIDLLNKIVKGEEVPKKIKFYGKYYTWYDNGYTGNKGYCLEPLKADSNSFLEINTVFDLNREVEIIEERNNNNDEIY